MKTSSVIKNLLKLALVVGLLVFLTKKGFLSLEATRNAFQHLDLILPAVALVFGSALLGVVRWRWLLEAQGLRLTYKRTLELAFVGNFFNIALPGAVSGDLIKAFYIGKEVEGKRAGAFGSILFDRLVGVSALVLVSAVALMLNYHRFENSGLLAGIRLMLIIAAICVVAFFSYLFLVRESFDPLLRAFQWAEQKMERLGSLTRIYEGVRTYHHHRWTVMKSLVLSIFVHCCVAFACYLFALALGDLDISRWAVFIVTPLGLLVTAVPVFPAGVGTGHAAFGWLYQFLGSQRGADVFSLYALCQISLGAIGGLVYLRFKGLQKASTVLA